MSIFWDNLSKHLKEKNISRYRLSKLSNGRITESKLARIAKGEIGPSPDIVHILSEIPELELEKSTLTLWVIKDKYNIGDVENENKGAWSQFNEAFKKAKITTNNAEFNARTYWGMKDDFEDPPPIRPVPAPDYHAFPVLGRVTAGALCYAEQEELGTALFALPPKAGRFALLVEGDSMFPPVYSGSHILVEEVHDFRAGGWYVVQTENGETSFKVVEPCPDGLLLRPLNPAWPSFKISEVVKGWRVLMVAFVPGGG